MGRSESVPTVPPFSYLRHNGSKYCQHLLCLKKRANFGKLQFQQGLTNFDNFG